GVDQRVLGGDDQVEAVGGELLGELAPDAAGGAGHEGELTCGIAHPPPLPRERKACTASSNARVVKHDGSANSSSASAWSQVASVHARRSGLVIASACGGMAATRSHQAS